MPVSALKKLKANLHERRTGSGHNGGGRVTKSKPGQQTQQRRETPAQRANRLRQETLLPELQRRSKSGGIVDRRLGEDDPRLAPEERALKRFVAESSRRSKRSDAFNLDDDDDADGGIGLTHGGRPLDDLAGDMIPNGNDEDDDGRGDLFSRTKRPLDDVIEDAERRQQEAMEADDGEPARKKSKKEIMEDVIAQSKRHKYERQQAHEKDEDKREELDKGLPELLSLLGRGSRKGPAVASKGPPGANDEEIAKEYDQRLRQMARDKRAAPSERTKTDEEKAEEHAAHLRELEDQRLRRMRGETIQQGSDHDDSDEDDGAPNHANALEEAVPDDSATFGFVSSKAPQMDRYEAQPELDDEDEFLIERDLVADSDDELDDPVEQRRQDSGEDSDGSEEEEDDASEPGTDDDDQDFLRDVLSSDSREKNAQSNDTTVDTAPAEAADLAYTYPIPQTHAELLKILATVKYSDVPVVVQRIRACHHASLAAENKTKLAHFACVLTDHVAYLPTTDPKVSLEVVEALIRHIHSMARSSPIEIARTFRCHIARIGASASNSARPDSEIVPSAGDVAVLAAVASIFPTSDHFHQVCTPAATVLGHWLSVLAQRARASFASSPSAQNQPQPTFATRDAAAGTALVQLTIKYHMRAARLVPEALRFVTSALSARPSTQPEVTAALAKVAVRLAHIHGEGETASGAAVEALSPLYSAFCRRIALDEQSAPSKSSKKDTALHEARSTLKHTIRRARLARRPLLEHAHKPLPIKTALPSFADSFHPGRHYDVDADRAAAGRLRREVRQEKRGAMRELRRDAEFVAREKLSARRAADAAYEDKFRRIVGGIQREEGRGANEYEREKEQRKRARSRF